MSRRTDALRAELVAAGVHWMETTMTPKTLVLDAAGHEIHFEAAAALMDRDIAEKMHDTYEPGFDNPQEFLREYARRHDAAFGEAFAPYAGGAW